MGVVQTYTIFENGDNGPIACASYERVSDALVSLGVARSDYNKMNWDPASIYDAQQRGVTPGQDIFFFQDSLQSTAPCFIRLGYQYWYRNSGVTTGFTVQVGTGFDENNNITGANVSPLCQVADSTGNVQHQNAYVSAGPDRMCIALGEGPNSTSNMLVNVERTKDAAGNSTDYGIIFQCLTGHTAYAGGPAKCLNMVIPFGNTLAGYNTAFIGAYNYGSITMARGNVVGTSEIVPFNFTPYPPGYGLLVYYGSDFPEYSLQNIVMSDGNAHTYLALQGANNDGLFHAPNRTMNGHLLMRYE